MWDFFLKFLVFVCSIPFFKQILENINGFLTYRQNGDKNKLALLDLLARELDKKEPSAYLVESCISRIHNIRPLSWQFLKIVLPCSHSMEIIDLVSSGRRVLDLFDIGVEGGQPVVRYAAALSNPSKRRNTMFACIFLVILFYALFSYAYWQLLGLVFEHSWRNTVNVMMSGEILKNIMQMLLFAAAMYFFILQTRILRRADERLSKIRMLIAASFPLSEAEREQESIKTEADSL
ncbi:hypothetical protein [Cronobacter dublinensis]|uniref:hypothetical protein n=2 Tax=Cronobacter TaxID=413496 RepID=UPI00300E4DFF